MRIPIAVLIAASFTAVTAQAKADIITTYNVNGTFADGATLSGTVTIDTTTRTSHGDELTDPQSRSRQSEFGFDALELRV
jgi:hypothetical protein